MVARTMDMIIIGPPIFRKSMNVIGYPLLLEMPVRTTLADAPIIVPFQPKHAPMDTAHQSGHTSIPSEDMV